VVPAHGGKERRDIDVGADDGVEHPFEAEIGDAFKGGAEGVDAADGDGRCGCEALAGEEAQEGGFAGAIGADEERSATGWEGEVYVLEAEGAVLEGVAEALDGDGGARR